MIRLTPRAAKKVRGFFHYNDLPEGTCLRVGIKSGGGCELAYSMDYATEAESDDEVFAVGGIRVITDPKSYLYLNGTELDYDERLTTDGFASDGLKQTSM